MNRSQINKKVFSLFAFVVLLVAANSAQAAVDYFLQIKGIDGEGKEYQRVVQCATGNHVDLGNLKQGKYSVILVNSNGSPIAIKKQGVPTRVSVTIVVDPRKAANAATTGTPKAAMVTGRRSWKPITIKREIDAASPKFFTIAAGDVNGDGVADVVISL